VPFVLGPLGGPPDPPHAVFAGHLLGRPAEVAGGLDGALLVRVGLGLLDGQRGGDVLQRLALGPDPQEDLRDPAEQHRGGPDQEPERDQADVAAVDERAELQWSGAAAGGPHRLEQRDGQPRISIGTTSLTVR
jgi:hypothetical protein